MISAVGKKLLNLQGLPYMPPNLVNFDLETSENGWQVFPNPLIFCIGRHCQPYRIDVIQQTAGKHVLCSGTSLHSRTTECLAGLRWSLPCI